MSRCSEALTTTDKLISFIRATEARAFLPETLYLKSKAVLGLGQVDIARNNLVEARLTAETIGSRRMLWSILLALSQIEPGPVKAEDLRRQAQEIVQDIANHTPPELRASFLNLPEVRAVLAE
jgi:hypothetical protein